MRDCEHCSLPATRQYCEACRKYQQRHHGELPPEDVLEERYAVIRGEVGRGASWWNGTEWVRGRSVKTFPVDPSQMGTSNHYTDED